MEFQTSNRMRHSDINVSVIRYPDRKSLVLRYRDPTTSKYKTRSAGTANQRDAERTAAKWEAELREGRYRDPIKTTWEEFRDRYEVEVVPGLAPKTGIMVATVFNAVERIVSPLRLSDLTASRLSQFQSHLRSGGCAEPTIRTYLAHLVSALRWGAGVGLLHSVPQVQRAKRAKGAKLMKGRPITPLEFERLLACVEPVTGADEASAWRYYLRGLWLSGLRLREALELYWDRTDRLCIDLSGPRPMLRIPAELEKGHQDRVLPITPDFAVLLGETPAIQRQGRVFVFPGAGPAGPRPERVSKTISRIGALAGIQVNVDARNGRIKYASAHDLRRSFGERWARLVMPQVLRELMRHESIETTLRYYVGRNAELTADAVWSAFTQQQQASAGNSFGNSALLAGTADQ